MSYLVNPLTEHLGAEVVGLKLHPNMLKDEIKYISLTLPQVILKVLKESF